MCSVAGNVLVSCEPVGRRGVRVCGSVAGNVLVSCEPVGRRGVTVCVALWQGMYEKLAHWSRYRNPEVRHSGMQALIAFLQQVATR